MKHSVSERGDEDADESEDEDQATGMAAVIQSVSNSET